MFIQDTDFDLDTLIRPANNAGSFGGGGMGGGITGRGNF